MKLTNNQLTNLLINKFTNSPINFQKAPLHLSRELYKSHLFMQNKANFKNDQIYITAYITRGYENFKLCGSPKNKAKQSQFKPNFSSILALFLTNEPNFKPNNVKMGKVYHPLRKEVLALEHIPRGWCAAGKVEKARFDRPMRCTQKPSKTAATKPNLCKSVKSASKNICEVIIAFWHSLRRNFCRVERDEQARLQRTLKREQKIVKDDLPKSIICDNLRKSAVKYNFVNPVILSKNISVVSVPSVAKYFSFWHNLRSKYGRVERDEQACLRRTLKREQKIVKDNLPKSIICDNLRKSAVKYNFVNPVILSEKNLCQSVESVAKKFSTVKNNSVQIYTQGICAEKEVRLFIGDGDIQFFYEAVEGSSLDAEDSCGGKLFAFSIFESFNDNLSLDLIESRQLIFRISFGFRDNNIKGKRSGLNFAADSEDISPFNCICELTDVPGPGVIYEKLFYLLREYFGRLIIKVGLIFQKEFGEGNDIFVSLPERRDLKSNDVQSIIEVRAEGSVFDHLPQVFCAGGKNPNVNRKGCRRAERIDGLLLKDSQQFCLQLKRYLAYFIEKDCPAISSPEETKRAVNGTGKSSFCVAEQLAFEEVAGECCAIDGDKNFFCPVTCTVYLSSHDFLADTGFADYYHGTLSCGDGLNGIKN